MKQFKCLICGYIHKGENPPDECPVCKASKDKFIEIEIKSNDKNLESNIKQQTPIMRFKCSVCGYIHDNADLPERCPICKASKDKFVPFLTEIENGLIYGNILDLISTSNESTKKITHFKTNDLTLETYYFLPGQIVDYHKHPNGNQILIVLQGKGVFYTNNDDNTNEKATNIKEGDYILVVQNVWHKIVNNSNNILILTQIMLDNIGIIVKNKN